DAELAALGAAVDAAVDRRMEQAAVRLAAIDRQRAVVAGMGVAERRLEGARLRLERAQPDRRVAAERARLVGLGRELEALSPVRVLERGYAVVRLRDGTVVRSAGQGAGDADVRLQPATGSY